MNMKEASPVAFLLGVPRSGTTLLSLLLNQHQAIHSPQEPWLLLALDALGQVHPEHPADAPLMAGLMTEFLGSDRRDALRQAAFALYRHVLAGAGKSLLVDKTPRYYLCLELLEAFSAQSRCIWLRRNPLDVAASYRTSWNIDLPQIIRNRADSPFLFDYILGNRYLDAFAARHSPLLLHYENLVRQPENEIARVFAHLDLAQDSISVQVDPQVAGYAGSAFADKKIFFGHDVHAKSIDSYKTVFDRDDIAVLLGALGQAAFARLGYAHVWDEACAAFALDAPPALDTELSATAERLCRRRQAVCKAAQNDYFLSSEYLVLAGQLEEVNLQLQQVSAANIQLTGQHQAAAQHNAELQQQLGELQGRGLRARVADVGQYVSRNIKQRVRQALWRLATAPPASPLPRITVVTPVFNCAAHVGEAIESVLGQDYPDLEYIIVDGGSTDGTLDVIRRYMGDEGRFPHRIARVISESDAGMYDAIAKGLEQSTGAIQCYLNADDCFLPGGLRAVGTYFAAHPTTQIIYHEDEVLIDGWRYPNVRQPAGIGLVDLLAGHILFQDGVFWRREAYAAVGGIRRDLACAGDFDLWLRMAAHFPLVRRPDHVSRFRIRPGQLSEQMERYHAEMRRAIGDFLAGLSPLRRMRLALRLRVRRVRRRFGRHVRQRDRLFFPIDFAHLPPPPCIEPPPAAAGPRSPVDGRPAERLLFTTPDTRFGDSELNYLYLDTRHGIAITHPPLAADKLDGLYRRHYSQPPTELRRPSGASPYRYFNGRRLWEKLALRLPIEKLRLLPGNVWEDHTLAELEQVLAAVGVDTRQPLRFLDAGCFEGHLLDRIRAATCWRACGLEPNAAAVEQASAKGHCVWQGRAEQAVEIIPDDQQFDIVFLGQSIEHVDDPVRVLRRLRQLLAPGGVIVASTPSLDSREIDWFGPTWAHWHAPYHRHIFSRRGITAVVRQAGLVVRCLRSFSHPYWTTMSFAQNGLGLGGSASHAVAFEHAIALRAQRAQYLKRLIWDRLGKGDYFLVVMQDGADE